MSDFFGKKHYTKEENRQLAADIGLYNDIIREEKLKSLTGECDCDTIARALLDSSLITATPDENYTHKIVQCGDYFQVYDYHKKSVKKKSDIEKVNFRNTVKQKSRGELIVETEERLYQSDGFLNWQKIKPNKDPPFWLHLNETVIIKKEKTEDEKIILKKNIQRAKVEFQKIVKCNESKFKTFITLTIADNMSDIESANELFRIWRTKVQSVLKKQKKEFSYVCVPEFQKRGAVHYHLLTNLDYENSEIIIPQKEFTEKQLAEMSEEQRNKCKDAKYWKYGFSNVFKVSDIGNAAAYISKYITKDIDSRLWGKRRYHCSQNLKRPSCLYIDKQTVEGFKYLLEIESNYDLKFKSVYSNVFGEFIDFQEFKKKEAEVV